MFYVPNQEYEMERYSDNFKWMLQRALNRVTKKATSSEGLSMRISSVGCELGTQEEAAKITKQRSIAESLKLVKGSPVAKNAFHLPVISQRAKQPKSVAEFKRSKFNKARTKEISVMLLNGIAKTPHRQLCRNKIKSQCSQHQGFTKVQNENLSPWVLKKTATHYFLQ